MEGGGGVTNKFLTPQAVQFCRGQLILYNFFFQKLSLITVAIVQDLETGPTNNVFTTTPVTGKRLHRLHYTVYVLLRMYIATNVS